jgi:hypothetical protein
MDSEEKKLEVTDAMVAAALPLLADYDRGWDNPKELLTRIYEAMSGVRNHHRLGSQDSQARFAIVCLT